MNNRKKSCFKLIDGYLENNVEPFVDDADRLNYRAVIYPGIERFGPNRIFVKPTNVTVPFIDSKKEKEIYNEYGKITDYDMCPDCVCNLASTALDYALNEARCEKFISVALDDSSKIHKEIKDAIEQFQDKIEGILERHGYKVLVPEKTDRTEVND